MFIKRLIYTSFAFVLLSTLFSCTEIIEMEFSTDFERLVVDGRIMDQDTLQYIKLAKINLDPENGIVSPISNASVVLNDGTLDIVFEEDADEKGLYLGPANFRGKGGKTYNLTISETGVLGTDKKDLYLATVPMANKLVMDSVTAQYYNLPQFGMIGYWLQVWAQEPPEENYYLFKAWKNGVLLTDTLYEYQQSDDAMYNDTYLEAANCQFLADQREDEYVESGDTLTLEIDNIDKGYYDYLNSAQSEYRGTNPLFGGPPANVISNISNGAVGVFRVFSPSKKTTIIENADRGEENPN